MADDKFAFQPNRRQFLTGGAARVVTPVLRSEAAAMTPEAEEAYHIGYAHHTHGLAENSIHESIQMHYPNLKGHVEHAVRGYKLAKKHYDNRG